MSTIYDEQSVIDYNVKQFSPIAVEKAKRKFVTEYDYYSLYPSKRGSAEDIYRTINRILLLKKDRFTVKELAAVLKTTVQGATNYVRTMVNFGLVVEVESQGGRGKTYEVSDPKIKQLIQLGIQRLG